MRKSKKMKYGKILIVLAILAVGGWFAYDYILSTVYPLQYEGSIIYLPKGVETICSTDGCIETCEITWASYVNTRQECDIHAQSVIDRYISNPDINVVITHECDTQSLGGSGGYSADFKKTTMENICEPPTTTTLGTTTTTTTLGTTTTTIIQCPTTLNFGINRPYALNSVTKCVSQNCPINNNVVYTWCMNRPTNDLILTQNDINNLFPNGDDDYTLPIILSIAIFGTVGGIIILKRRKRR